MTQRISRRRFLGTGTGVITAAALAPATTIARAAPAVAAEDDPTCEPAPGLLPPERIGIQLYTIRDQVSSLGFAKVFEELAEMGYAEVEFAGYTQGSAGAITLPEIRQLLDDHGLKGIGSHASVSTSNVQQKLDEAEILGLPTIGNATTNNSAQTRAAWEAEADAYNTIGEACAARGVKFYIHNHQFEFRPLLDEPTTRVYDVLLAETDPNLVFFQMDIFWAYVGQHMFGRPPFDTFEPLDYVVAQPERFPLFHVKDGERNQANPQGYDMVDVGQGVIDFQAFFSSLDTADLANHEYLMERDNASSHPHGSLASALASFWWMRRGLKPQA